MGFLEGYYYIEDRNGDEAKVYVKNENIICWLNGRAIITPPDLIVVIDKKSLMGMHNGMIKKGDEVAIVGCRASSMWRTKKGQEAILPGGVRI